MMIAIIGCQIVKQEYSKNCRLNHWKPECDAKCKHYTINAQYTRKKTKGEICMKANGDCPNQVQSDKMVLGTVRWGGWTM